MGENLVGSGHCGPCQLRTTAWLGSASPPSLLADICGSTLPADHPSGPEFTETPPHTHTIAGIHKKRGFIHMRISLLA
ncbi:hypothetical protein XELAEV_18003909mg [Xenopus laevis]|uniref:Uncharacterized protein n=1 Tax=Xenopus laevis TaxID=8355 RepID=A0A974BRV8_XENLA|nr:hypothetical protein XELAEV_18003909mg [Xenopus laevis]